MMQWTAGNRVILLRNGAEYFPALLAAIDAAAVEIHLQTYIFESDAVGQTMAEALMRAVDRGVRVHLLLDGFGCKDLSKSFVSRLTAAGVEVLFYGQKISPWTLQRNRLRRMHRKLAVMDGRLGFVGGINIVDDYNTPGQTPPRMDYAVQVEGALLQKMHKSAQTLWRYVHWVSDRQWVPVHTFSWQSVGQMHAAYVVRDNVLHRRDIENSYLATIHAAKQEVVIVNAYFLPGLRFRHALYQAKKRGVRVVLLLQSRVEYLLLDLASHALYSALLQQGVEIYEYHKSFMHSKVAVIDGNWATVGSSNIDPFSLLLAREANVFVQDAHFAQILRQDIAQTIQEGAKQVTLEDWTKHHMFKRFFSWLVYGLVRLMMGAAGYTRHR